MNPKPLLIDCDPGQDDAIALLLALASPEDFTLLAVTTVAGNVPLHLTQTNARKICELANRPDVLVYAGCERPLLRPLVTAEEVHGVTGLDGPNLPDPRMPLQPQHSVEALIQFLLTAQQPVTLATLGPLTNIALALIQQPRIRESIQELVLMGGSIGQGNITASAEFNIYVDPHAAQIVFSSGIPLTMIGLDVTHQAIATPARIQRIRDLNTPVGTAVSALLSHHGVVDMARYGLPGGPLHDPCVIAYLVQPQLFRGRPSYVTVETQSELTMGRTVVDLWNSSGQSTNVNVLQDIDADGFFTLLTERLGRYG